MVFKIKKQLFISFILYMSELSVFAVKWQTPEKSSSTKWMKYSSVCDSF